MCNLSLERQRALCELVGSCGFVIAEDHPYRHVRVEAQPVLPVKALEERVIVIGLETVSRILDPDLRVGGAIAAKELVDQMARQKTDSGSSPVTRRIVNSPMRSNRPDGHIETIATEMRLHRDALIAVPRSCLPAARLHVPQGGLFPWLELAPQCSELAIAHGVEVTPGRHCFPDVFLDSFVRFSFSAVPPERLAEGIRGPGEAYRDLEQRRIAP